MGIRVCMVRDRVLMVKNKSRVRVRAISGLQLVGSRPWTGFRLNCIC